MKRHDCRKPRGSVYVNNGYWCLEARLPGETRRRKHPLRAPGSPTAMRADRPRELALEAAHRLWESVARQERHAPAGPLVDDVCDAYVRHCAEYYRAGTESLACAAALRTFRDMFGSRPVAELVHTDMVAVRDAMARSGRFCRTTVNRYMGIITNRMMPWACDAGLVRPAVKVELSGVVPLKRGRSAARETAPVRAVGDAEIEATLAHMMPNTADMVRVHRLTGMRPQEVCCLRWRDIDTSATPWRFVPELNKNAWRGAFGQPRVVCIGPRARAILERHRGTERPFSPVAAVAELMAAKRAARVSPFYPCRDEAFSRADPHAQRKPRERWDTASYSQTIAYACARANVPRWSANRLRHALATQVRRKFGIAAASAVLGHSRGLRVTDRYSWEAAEDEMYAAAAPAVEELG